MSSLNSLESIALILLGAAILLSVWGWASAKIDTVKEESGNDRNSSVICSQLEIEFVDRKSNESHTEVYFSSNMNLPLLEAEFGNGNESFAMNLTDIRGNEIRSVTAPLSDAEARISSPRCS